MAAARTSPGEEQDTPAVVRTDQVVATVLRFARLLRRLASSREDPLANAANASALLSGFGVDWIDDDRFRQWRGEFLTPNQPGTWVSARRCCPFLHWRSDRGARAQPGAISSVPADFTPSGPNQTNSASASGS